MSTMHDFSIYKSSLRYYIEKLISKDIKQHFGSTQSTLHILNLNGMVTLEEDVWCGLVAVGNNKKTKLFTFRLEQVKDGLKLIGLKKLKGGRYDRFDILCIDTSNIEFAVTIDIDVDRDCYSIMDDFIDFKINLDNWRIIDRTFTREPYVYLERETNRYIIIQAINGTKKAFNHYLKEWVEYDESMLYDPFYLFNDLRTVLEVWSDLTLEQRMGRDPEQASMC